MKISGRIFFISEILLPNFGEIPAWIFLVGIEKVREKKKNSCRKSLIEQTARIFRNNT
jgi:hypothetical protein